MKGRCGLNAESLREAWEASEWREVEGETYLGRRLWRRAPGGRRCYPAGEISEVREGEFFISLELWSKGRRRPEVRGGPGGLGSRAVRGARTYGTIEGHRDFEAAALAADRIVTFALQSAAVPRHREDREEVGRRRAAEAALRRIPAAPTGGAPSGLRAIHEQIAGFLSRLSGAWEVPVKLTLVARVPGNEAAGLCVTDDTFEELAAEVDRLRLRPAEHLDDREAERARLREIFTGRPS